MTTTRSREARPCRTPSGTDNRYKRRGVAFAGLIALLLAACGSTVQPGGREGATGIGGDAAGDEFSLDRGTSGATSDVAAGDGSMSDPSGDSSLSDSTDRSGGLPAETAAPAGGSPAATPSPGETGRGFTEKQIYIGYFTWSEVETFGNAANLPGFAFGDQRAQAEAIIKDINGHGGLAGREIVPVFYDIRTSELLGDPNRAGQEACEKWTKDRPVFAAIVVPAFVNHTLFACMASNKTPLVFNSDAPLLHSTYARYAPYLYSTLSPQMERFVGPWLRRAAASGYFTGWDTTLGRPSTTAEVKVGILTTSDNDGSEFDRIVRAELARQGRSVEMTFATSSATDQQGLNAAVLQFKTRGVTHVVPGSRLMLLFPQAAENQRYRPRYAIATNHIPTVVQRAAPRGQLAGAIGVGYHPGYDVQNRQDPGDPSAAAARCRQAMQNAGQDTSPRDAWSLMTKACDAFNFIVAASDSGGLSPEGLSRGAQEIGSMEPAGTFRITFPGGRTDGPSAVRDLAYENACECFKYLTPVDHDM